MIGKSFLPVHGNFLRFYMTLSWLIAGLGLVGVVAGWVYFANREQSKGPDGATS
jgi:hypothetical protein